MCPWPLMAAQPYAYASMHEQSKTGLQQRQRVANVRCTEALSCS